MPPQKIFMTGASGYIGSTIIEAAIPLGYTITALSRSESSDTKLLSLGATPIRGDLSSHSLLTSEASKADIVISLADALAKNFTTMTKQERFAINNAAISALAEGLKGSGKPLIITSGTLAVAPDPNGKETDETSPLWPEGALFATNFETRSLAHKDQGIRTCAVRLAPWVYGRGGSGVKLFMQSFAQAGKGFYIDNGSALTTTVHVEDAARLYLLAAEKGRAGEAYNACSENDVSQKQLAEAIGRVLDVPITSLAFDDAVGSVGRFLAEFLRAENRASSRKAKEELGWDFRAERGILKETEEGSYVDVANELKKTT